MKHAVGIASVLALIATSLSAGTLQTVQGVVSIVANAPAAYDAIVHPVKSVKAVGGSVRAVAKKLKRKGTKK